MNFGIRCMDLLLACRKSFPPMPHPERQSNGLLLLKQNRSNGMDGGRSRGSGERTTMTTSQSRQRRLVSCWNDSDFHRIRSGQGVISTRTEWCFFGVGGCEGQQQDRIHFRKTKQVVAVQCPCWHCTATLKNQRESANMLSLEDTPTAMARTLFALLVLSNLPSDLCFE